MRHDAPRHLRSGGTFSLITRRTGRIVRVAHRLLKPQPDEVTVKNTSARSSRLPYFYFLALGMIPLAACTSTVSNGGSGDGAGGDASTATSTIATTTSSGCPEEGCSSTVDPTGGGGFGVGGSDPSGSGGASVSADAIALLWSQLPGVDPGEGGTVASTGSGPSIDPNTLVVVIGGQSVACSDPYLLDCGAEWFVSLNIPPAMQAIGTYPLDDTGVNGFASETGDGVGPECSFGGGTFWGGTLTITSIDAVQVTGTLQNTDSYWSFDADGAFTALRCP